MLGILWLLDESLQSLPPSLESHVALSLCVSSHKVTSHVGCMSMTST